MADIAVDANILVGLLDQNDSLHIPAETLLRRLSSAGEPILLLDLCVSEALSVLCRRATQRRMSPPDLDVICGTVRAWYDAGQITFVQEESEAQFTSIVDIVHGSRGALNFNDAFLAVLQREGRIGAVASFDRNLDAVEGFRRIE